MTTDLLSSTILWLTVTILIYQIFFTLFIKTKQNSLLHPVAWSIASIGMILIATKISYKTYFDSAKVLHFILGPATVALAIPLYEQRKKLARLLRPLLCSLFIGGITGILSSIYIAKFFRASLLIQKSVAAKSVTTPIAMGITEKLGGDISLIAAMVALTGVFGAMVAIPFLKLIPFHDVEAKGFSIGMASHGVGTARAFQESSELGAFSGLAIGLNGLLTALLMPLIFRILNLS